MPRPRKRRQYATGSVYQRARDGRWVATIEAGYTATGARRRIVLTAKTEAEAKRKMEKRRAEIDRGGSTEVSTRTTVKAWSDKWLELAARTSRPKTFTTEQGAVRKWIVPTLGHRRLDQLTPADVRALDTAMRAAVPPVSTSTIHRYHGILLRMLKAAVAEGHDVSPRALAVKPPALAVHDRTALSTTEALRVLEVAAYLSHGSRWAAAFLQGMRQGECLGLTWDEVDLAAGQLTVSWQLQSLPYLDKHDRSAGFRVPDGYEARQIARAAHLVRPKTRAGWRTIPLVPFMRDALAVWREGAPTSAHGLVWPNTAGGPLSIRQDTAEWEALQQRADVRHPTGRWYAGHESRHTTATLLMELGVPESVIVAIMGHSSILTSRKYMHPETTQAARQALERVAEQLHLVTPSRPAEARALDAGPSD